VVRLGYTAPPTPTRSPGITLTRVSSVPGAAGAALRLAGAFAPGFALRARAPVRARARPSRAVLRLSISPYELFSIQFIDQHVGCLADCVGVVAVEGYLGAVVLGFPFDVTSNHDAGEIFGDAL